METEKFCELLKKHKLNSVLSRQKWIKPTENSSWSRWVIKLSREKFEKKQTREQEILQKNI